MMAYKPKHGWLEFCLLGRNPVHFAVKVTGEMFIWNVRWLSPDYTALMFQKI
jgi:hypothetical protein